MLTSPADKHYHCGCISEASCCNVGQKFSSCGDLFFFFLVQKLSMVLKKWETNESNVSVSEQQGMLYKEKPYWYDRVHSVIPTVRTPSMYSDLYSLDVAAVWSDRQVDRQRATTAALFQPNCTVYLNVVDAGGCIPSKVSLAAVIQTAETGFCSLDRVCCIDTQSVPGYPSGTPPHSYGVWSLPPE